MNWPAQTAISRSAACSSSALRGFRTRSGAIAAAVAKKDAEIAGWKADQKENMAWQVEQHQQITALTAERDKLAAEVKRLRDGWEFEATVKTETLKAQRDGLREQVRVLREAGDAVVKRWETPLWKDVPATAQYIYALRDALDATKEQAAQAGSGHA